MTKSELAKQIVIVQQTESDRVFQLGFWIRNKVTNKGTLFCPTDRLICDTSNIVDRIRPDIFSNPVWGKEDD